MSLLREFIKKVVPHVKLTPASDGPGLKMQSEAALVPKQRAEARAAPDKAGAAAGEAAADAAVHKAQIKKRLTALVGPFKEAVADDGANAKRLHGLFHTIKTRIEKHQFTEASEGLDLLEQLLSESVSQEAGSDDEIRDLENVVAAADGKQMAEPGTEKAAVAGAEAEPVGGLDVPTPNRQRCTIEVKNNTKRKLHLDPTSLNVTEELGHFTKSPPKTIDIGQQKTFEALNDSLVINDPRGLDLRVRYFLDDEKKTTWELHFKMPTSLTFLVLRKKLGENKGDSRIQGLRAKEFQEPDDPDISDPTADDCTFSFEINPADGPVPPPPPPPPGPVVNLSCRITVTNKTQHVLTLISQEGDSNHPKVGDYVTDAPVTLQPEESKSFVFAQTPNEKDKTTSIQGSVLYAVGAPAVTTWRCVWVNPAGMKNTARHEFDPDTKEFFSPDQIDDGDENVPVHFTLLGGGQGPQPPVDPDEEYKPPTPEKQPTLRKNDPNNDDGWVEYLQEQLNDQLKGFDPPKQFKYTFPLTVNGKFDSNVDQAVQAFQTKAKQSNPSFMVDGIVGDQTWAALRHGTPEKPGVREHKTDKGFKARWLTEDEVCTYLKSSDTMSLKLCSVGTVDLADKVAKVFVTPPNGTRVGKPAKIGKPLAPLTETGEGNVHEAKVSNCTKAFRLQGVDLQKCQIEAYFEQELGGDRWSYNPGKGTIKVE